MPKSSSPSPAAIGCCRDVAGQRRVDEQISSSPAPPIAAISRCCSDAVLSVRALAPQRADRHFRPRADRRAAGLAGRAGDTCRAARLGPRISRPRQGTDRLAGRVRAAVSAAALSRLRACISGSTPMPGCRIGGLSSCIAPPPAARSWRSRPRSTAPISATTSAPSCSAGTSRTKAIARRSAGASPTGSGATQWSIAASSPFTPMRRIGRRGGGSSIASCSAPASPRRRRPR